MVIDTSAIVAIALGEPEATAFEQRIAYDPVRLISAPTMLEAAMVIEARLGEPGGSELDLWLHKVGVEIVAVGPDHADEARRAWLRYGKRPSPLSVCIGRGRNQAWTNGARSITPAIFCGWTERFNSP